MRVRIISPCFLGMLLMSKSLQILKSVIVSDPVYMVHVKPVTGFHATEDLVYKEMDCMHPDTAIMCEADNKIPVLFITLEHPSFFVVYMSVSSRLVICKDWMRLHPVYTHNRKVTERRRVPCRCMRCYTDIIVSSSKTRNEDSPCLQATRL